MDTLSRNCGTSEAVACEGIPVDPYCSSNLHQQFPVLCTLGSVSSTLLALASVSLPFKNKIQHILTPCNEQGPIKVINVCTADHTQNGTDGKRS